MSKKSKAASKKANADRKRAIKASNTARWQELKRLGQNGKSLRARKNAKASKKALPVSHPNGPCGNIGCKHCNSHLANSTVSLKTLTTGQQILKRLAERKKLAA